MTSSFPHSLLLHGEAGRRTDGQAGTQTDRRTDRQAGRQTEDGESDPPSGDQHTTDWLVSNELLKTESIIIFPSGDFMATWREPVDSNEGWNTEKCCPAALRQNAALRFKYICIHSIHRGHLKKNKKTCVAAFVFLSQADMEPLTTNIDLHITCERANDGI